MSLASTRAAFPAVVNGVEGVKGFQYRPSAIRVGHAWPMLAAGERGPGSMFVLTWRIIVALPADERAASVWMDEHLQPLIDAIEAGFAFVTGFRPAVMDMEENDTPVIEILTRGDPN